jgi:hypothetical protein
VLPASVGVEDLLVRRSALARRNPTEAIPRDPPLLINLLLWGLAATWVSYRS